MVAEVGEGGVGFGVGDGPGEGDADDDDLADGVGGDRFEECAVARGGLFVEGLDGGGDRGRVEGAVAGGAMTTRAAVAAPGKCSCMAVAASTAGAIPGGGWR